MNIEVSEILNKLEDISKQLGISNMEKEHYTLDEACKYLKISKSYMYKLTSTRVIPHYKPYGKLIYFKKEDLDKVVFTNRIKSISDVDLEANMYMERNGKRN